MRRSIGVALRSAQLGRKHEAAKEEPRPEHEERRQRDTVRFTGHVYVLHAFQKKSKKGIQTPKHVIELVRSRLATAAQDHRARENAE